MELARYFVRNNFTHFKNFDNLLLSNLIWSICMKKKITVAIIFIVLISLIIVVVTATMNPYKKNSKVLKSTDEVAYSVPSDYKNNEYSKDKPPEELNPEENIIDDILYKQSDIVSKKVRYEDKGKSFELEFEFIQRNGKNIFIPIPESQGIYRILYLPNNNSQVLLSYDFNIYYLDIEKGKISSLMNSSSEGHTKEEYFNKAKQIDFPLDWAYLVGVSPDGSHLAFISNRRSVFDEKARGGELWIKDLTTGEEYTALSDRSISDVYSRFASWDLSGESIIAEGQGQIVRINISSREIDKIVKENRMIYSINYPKIAYFNGRSEIEILNLETEEAFNFTDPYIDRLSSAQFSPDGEYIAFHFFSKRQGPLNLDLGLIDLKTKTLVFAQIPGGGGIDSFTWNGNMELLVTTVKISEFKSVKETIIVNVNDAISSRD